jgi:hypothetical protein
MSHYNLRRTADNKTYMAMRSSDERALFYFSIVVGEKLTFEGEGAPPNLLGRRIFFGPIVAKTPVYCKLAA